MNEIYGFLPQLLQLGVRLKQQQGGGGHAGVLEVEVDAGGRSSEDVPLVLRQRHDLLLELLLVVVAGPGGGGELLVRPGPDELLLLLVKVGDERGFVHSLLDHWNEAQLM